MSEKENEVNLNEIIKSDQEDSGVKDESINAEEKSDLSQKAEKLYRALREYVDENNGDAIFKINFGSLDESGDVSENHQIIYGDIDKILSPNQDDLAEACGLSQEAKNIFKALDAYAKKHNGVVYYHVGFGAFNNDDVLVDTCYNSYGRNDSIEMSVELILEDLI